MERTVSASIRSTRKIGWQRVNPPINLSPPQGGDRCGRLADLSEESTRHFQHITRVYSLIESNSTKDRPNKESCRKKKKKIIIIHEDIARLLYRNLQKLTFRDSTVFATVLSYEITFCINRQEFFVRRRNVSYFFNNR